MDELKPCIDEGLLIKLRSALRFAASHSVLTSKEEQALLAAARPAPDMAAVVEALQAFVDCRQHRTGASVHGQKFDGEAWSITNLNKALEKARPILQSLRGQS